MTKEGWKNIQKQNKIYILYIYISIYAMAIKKIFGHFCNTSQMYEFYCIAKYQNCFSM